MIVWLLAIGLISMLGQVVLLRELNVAFFGSELIYILALGLWLFWTATGAALGRRAALPTSRQVRLLFLLHGCLLPIVIIFVRGMRPLFGGVPGAYLSFPAQLSAMALALLPVGIMLGLLFQWAAKLYVGGRRTLAGAYAIESLGGLMGGLAATLILKAGMQNIMAALLCALLSAAACCHPWKRARPRFLGPAAIAVIVLLLLTIVWSADLDRRLTSLNHPDLLVSADSPYGRLTVTEAGGQISVFENDALAFDSEGTAAEEFAHLAAIQHPAPRSMLLLGGGIEGLARELLLHRPESVDYVELNGLLLELLGPRLPEDVRTFVADPRRFLDGAGRYDLILIGMPEPASGQANRFYTTEFFARCAARLNPGGIIAFRLGGAENLWTSHKLRRAASIKGALDAVFADSIVLPGVTNIFLASDEPLSRDPAALSGRLIEREIAGRLVIPAYVDYLYTNDRFDEIAGLLATEVAPVNSDLHPICYQYTLLIWLSKFFSVLAMFDLPEIGLPDLLRSPLSWLGLAALPLLMLLCRRRPALRRSLLAAIAGFTGMILETALILNYQTENGVLYQDLGLLLTAFMAGLALGAAVIDRLAKRRTLTRMVGAALMAALSALALLSYLMLEAGMIGGLPSSALMLLASGFLVAAIFAYASLHRSPDQRLVISPLYAADLLGGCLGSLIATLFLIPALGLSASALLTALIVAVAISVI